MRRSIRENKETYESAILALGGTNRQSLCGRNKVEQTERDHRSESACGYIRHAYDGGRTRSLLCVRWLDVWSVGVAAATLMHHRKLSISHSGE